MAEVSLDALTEAQTAFESFRHSLEDFSRLTKQNHNHIIHQCHETIESIKKKVKTTEESIENHRLTIGNMEQDRHRLQKEMEQLLLLSQEGHKDIQKLEKQRNNHEYALTTAKAGVKTTRKDGTTYLKMDYEGIQLLEQQVKQCTVQMEEKVAQTQCQKENITTLDGKIQVLKKEENHTHLALEEETQRLYRLQTQEKQLETSYKKIETDLMTYLSATLSFCQETQEKNKNQINSLTRCITTIEQYLAVSLLPEDCLKNEGKSL